MIHDKGGIPTQQRKDNQEIVIISMRKMKLTSYLINKKSILGTLKLKYKMQNFKTWKKIWANIFLSWDRDKVPNQYT